MIVGQRHGSQWLEHQVRAHILIPKQEMEKARLEEHRPIHKATPPNPSQAVPPAGNQLVKHMGLCLTHRVILTQPSTD